MSDTSVRRAAPADAAAIAGVHVRSWQIAYRGLVPDEVLDALSIAQRQTMWHSLLERSVDGAFTLVGERDDQIVGFCSMLAPSADDDRGGRTCEVTAIYVEPDLRRTGIGSTLLATALEEVRAAGWDAVTLWVFADNATARAFYRRFGFAADGAQTWHESSGQKEVRLRAPISG